MANKVELKCGNILVSAFYNGCHDLKSSAKDALAYKFGNDDYCKKELQSADMFFTAIDHAKKNSLTKITLIFEKED